MEFRRVLFRSRDGLDPDETAPDCFGRAAARGQLQACRQPVPGERRPSIAGHDLNDDLSGIDLGFLGDFGAPQIAAVGDAKLKRAKPLRAPVFRSEEHTSELQSLMRISYAVFCLKNNKTENNKHMQHHYTT